jgi:hypothetical protein
MSGGTAARLLLGPLLRYAGETEATVWVETDRACEVETLGCRARTFHVEGHHYALLRLEGLQPGSTLPYEVRLDGERAWPEEDSGWPPSFIRTLEPGGAVRLAFGSCRLCVPHEPPYTLGRDEHRRGREMDALRALALRMCGEPPEAWPHALLLLGDQVYADEVSLGALEFIRSRRNPDEPPREQAADFQEYTRLYWDAWGDPATRWLLSNVPTAMIFDDHDVHDDWNTSQTWVAQMRETSWWGERITGAFMSYWLYQHLGNLSPAELAEEPLLRAMQGASDGGPALREFARRADRETRGTRWSYRRDLGPARLVVVDTRAGRVLDRGGRRMVDAEEWRWLEEQATGGQDHLLIASSLPVLLAPAMHGVEAWNERVCDGAWGGVAALVGEKLRRALDLEHWAAFGDSFGKLTGLLRAVARGERGEAPATIIALSGDVHHAYLARARFRGGGARSAVYQAVCSPFRNPLDSRERRLIRWLWTRPLTVVGWGLARLAGVPEPGLHWRLLHPEVWFNNQVATLELRGREARLRIEKTVPRAEGGPALETVFERALSRDRRGGEHGG